MIRIAPVRLEFNPKTLWFDALDFDLNPGDAVVVSTARGAEFGHVAKKIFEIDEEETKNLKSPLKPVKRIAGEEDIARSEELAALSREALPVFKRLAGEVTPDMSPVAVEYLFDGDKAVFYFESEERIDFRELVHKLASELHVRVDMKQVGIRDGARMVGGLGHCGQELCCRRLGGEFNPVSIRMAKEQDLSLNPQKISGICGRLMCCLRYEYDAYKDFHSRAPKKNAKISTPDGEGKVVSLDVPREIVSIQVGAEKPVKVPLADMETQGDATRPNSVGEEAWGTAMAPVSIDTMELSSLFATELTGEDALGDRTAVRHNAAKSDDEAVAKKKRRRRRRSTTVETAEGEGKTKQKSTGEKTQVGSAKAEGTEDGASKSRSQRSRRVTRGGKKKSTAAKTPDAKKNAQVGRNSSALRAGRTATANEKPQDPKPAAQHRRRRRTHKAGASETQE